MAASPTPPHPMTATESPRETLPVFTAAPRPAITPQPSRPDHRRVGGRIDLGALSGVYERLLRERSDAQRRREFGAVLEGHLLRRVVGVEAVLRTATLACPALPAHCAPVEDDEVAHLRRNRLLRRRSSTNPAASCPSRKGNSSLMPPSR